jgi:small conductance mechanosensitive channel
MDISIPVLQIIAVVLLAALLHHISGRIISRLIRRAVHGNKYETKLDKTKREDTLIAITCTTVAVAIWMITTAVILRIFNINLTSVAAGAGFLGIVVGMGAQTTIRDFLAGIFILLENQYRVGDIVTLSGGSTGGGTSGIVEEITLRITKLRDLDGTLNIVRNGEAAIITNRTNKYSSVVLDIGVGYDSNIDTVEKVMNRVGKDMLKDEVLAPEINEPIGFFRVDAFGDSAVIIKVVGKVKPAKQWDIAGEYRRRLLKAFAEEGIDIAYPQLVVHQKTKK